MTHLNDIPLLAQLQYYLTSPYACSYLPGRIARSQVVTPAHLVNKSAYNQLIRAGFRRSGLFTYRPQCGECTACVPVRVVVDEFGPNRSQKRAMKRNAMLDVTMTSPYYDPEHFALYQRYQTFRHSGGGMDHDDREQYMQFLVASHVDTRLLLFREGKQLQMLSVVDKVEDGLSAVYTFFNPALPARSFGVFNILWQINLARELHLPYLYLGYWVDGSRKMVYKQQYQPLQGLVDGDWRAWTKA